MPLTEGGLILPKDDADIRTWGAVDVGDGFLYYPRRSSVDGGLIIAGAGLAADAAITNGSAGTRSAYERGINLLLGLIVDQVNGRGRMEINTLHSSEDSIAVQGEDVLFATATLTTTTATQIVAAPAAGNHHVIKKLSYQLREDVDTTATVRGGSGGTDVMAYDLSFDGTNGPPVVGLDFGTGGYPLATATAIHGKLSAAPSTGGVRFNVWYVTRPD
jgi:hypothetical protein